MLLASIPVWEAALAEENRLALEDGWEYAVAEGVVEVPISAADQQRFDALYAQEAETNAAALTRYGIDGMTVLAHARASINPDGTVRCREAP